MRDINLISEMKQKKVISYEDYMVLKLNEALNGPKYKSTPEFLRQMRENRRKNIEKKERLTNDNIKR